MIQLMNIEYYHYHDNEDEDIRVKDFFDDTHGLVKSLEININSYLTANQQLTNSYPTATQQLPNSYHTAT